MASSRSRSELYIPRSWPRRVRSGLLHAISLARHALTSTHAWAAHSLNPGLRLRTENERLRQEVYLLREELRLKDIRLRRILAIHRSQYQPAERLAILELRSARGWSLTQTAERMLLTTATVSAWVRRVDEHGPNAILQLQAPVNAYPDFVRHLVQRLKVLCPGFGQAKMAQVLARAGLHLSAHTIGRMLRRRMPSPPEPPRAPGKPITARAPHHYWHCDLTAVPIAFGFSTSWFPYAVPQRWPYCWWVALVVDHYSRRILAAACFPRIPSSQEMRTFLEGAARRAHCRPRYLVTDKGKQFIARPFRRWCRRQGIRPRFGAIDHHGALAIVERLNRTLKTECTRRLTLIPFTRSAFQRELSLYRGWFNAHRPHTALEGRTPDEVYFRRRPACRAPRFEPRARWTRTSRRAGPQGLIRGRPGVRLDLDVTFYARRRHLPLVALKRAA